ncbi:MAG: diadenosine tetraphosphatase [bacterium]|nr:diadenosine tetraphosphatase [bacterium]
MRWIVGDIQGCARELEALLERIRFDAARDELWAAGDVVNRGPDSLAALRMWIDTGARGVIGNHDVNALQIRAGERESPRHTLHELFAAPDADELLGKLRELPVLVHLPGSESGVRDVWLVHGGLHPRWTDLPEVAARLNGAVHDGDWLVDHEVSFATRVRCCTPAGQMDRYTGPPEGATPPFVPWDELYRGETLVVHGHWARRGFYRTPRTMGLDSGCVYGGELTAWCQEEDRIVRIASQAE